MKYIVSIILLVAAVSTFIKYESRNFRSGEKITRNQPSDKQKTLYRDHAALDSRKRKDDSRLLNDEETRRRRKAWRAKRKIQPKGVYK